MVALIGWVFVTSLLGSLHCAGMCGPFVSFYAGADGARGAARAWSHVAYNGGRLLTYVILGAVAGAAGAALDRAGALVGIGRAASVAAGALIALWGVYLLLSALHVRVPVRFTPVWLTRTVSRLYDRIAGRPPVVRATLLGLFSTLLPCVWLYGYAVVASGTGNALHGMAVMAFFWLGTLPIMAALGAGLQMALGPLRKHLPVITALGLITVGVLALWGRSAMITEIATGDPEAPASCPLHPTDPAPDTDARR